MDKIRFKADDGTVLELYVLERTRLAGKNYILVSDTSGDEEEGEAMILKEVSTEQDAEAVYEFIEEDAEFEAVADIFGELLEDVDLVDED